MEQSRAQTWKPRLPPDGLRPRLDYGCVPKVDGIWQPLSRKMNVLRSGYKKDDETGGAVSAILLKVMIMTML